MSINKLLSETEHRPYNLPAKRWSYYQEWNHAIFLHWEVPYDALRRLVPEKLMIDTFEGKYYISLVAFSMQKIRPAYFPAVSLISDFHEINVRTYVEMDGKKGVYFINIEAEKELSVFIARSLSKLPYEKSIIKRKDYSYRSVNASKRFKLNVQYDVKEPILKKTPLERWLTEQYCLYLNEGKDLYRFDVHHAPWPLRHVEIKKLDLQYKFDGINLSDMPYKMAHYSDGVKVVAWEKQRV